MCSQSGEEPLESQPFPQAMGNKEVGDSAGRERGKGVDNMFPLVLNTERNSMISAALQCETGSVITIKQCLYRREHYCIY